MNKTLFDNYEPSYFHALQFDYFSGYTLSKHEKKLLIEELTRRVKILS